MGIYGPIKFKSPFNTGKWQMGFNSGFNGLITPTKQQTVTVMTMVITVIIIIVKIKVCKYLEIEENHEIEYKNEKGKLKTE
jgi:hypothetical protein